MIIFTPKQQKLGSKCVQAAATVMILYLGGEELLSLDLTRPAEVILSGDGGGDVGLSPLSNDDLTSMNFLLPGPERSLLPVRLLLAARISLLTLSAIPQPTQQR